MRAFNASVVTASSSVADTDIPLAFVPRRGQRVARAPHDSIACENRANTRQGPPRPRPHPLVTGTNTHAYHRRCATRQSLYAIVCNGTYPPPRPGNNTVLKRTAGHAVRRTRQTLCSSGAASLRTRAPPGPSQAHGDGGLRWALVTLALGVGGAPLLHDAAPPPLTSPESFRPNPQL